jgi:predicted nucleotidyltransferase
MASPRTPEFGPLLARVARTLRAHRIPFMIIGGQAVLVHGEPRLTADVDVTLGVAPARLATVLEACRAIDLEPLPADVEDFVRDTFVLPAGDPESGIRVDLIFSTTPFESQAIERAVPIDVSGEAVPFATAEDLILHKLFAGRPRDIEDAEGVVRRKGDEVDWTYLMEWAREFAATPGREAMPSQVRRLRDLAGA